MSRQTRHKGRGYEDSRQKLGRFDHSRSYIVRTAMYNHHEKRSRFILIRQYSSDAVLESVIVFYNPS